MAFATAHNGGRSQVNFNFAGNGGEWWSIDLFKMYGQTNFTGLVPTDFDADGYPLANPSGKSVFWVGWLLGQDRRSGTLVMTWTGNGTLSFSGSGIVGTSGSLTSSGGAGRYEFTLATTSQVNVNLVSWTSKISGIKIFFKDQESLLGTTYFNPDFIAKIRAAKIGVIRMINWQEAGGNTNISQWSHRKPLTYATWGSAQMRPEIYCGSATGTNDYSINGNVGNGATVAGIVPIVGDPADKTLICCKFSNAQTFDKITGITFDNVNGYVSWTGHALSVNDPVMFGLNGATALPTTINIYECYRVKTVVDANNIEIARTSGGAKITFPTSGTGSGFFATRQPTIALNVGTAFPIKSMTCNSLGASAKIVTGQFYTFCYDDVQKSWILSGGYASTGQGVYGIINGIPYEVMIAASQECGAHPWFCAPHFSCYPQTDFTTNLASLVKSAQAQSPWMVPQFETIPNELFNPVALPWNMAMAHSYALAQSTGNSSWGANYHAWCGMVNSTNGQTLNSVFGGTVGGTGGLYRAISGVWTISFNSATTSHNERLTSALYISTFGKSASDAASNWITHVCCFQYLQPPTYYKKAQESTWADDYVATGNTANIATYVDDIASGANTYATLEYLKRCYTNCANWAGGYSNKDGNAIKLCGYEGGWSPDYTSNGTSNVDKFRAASKAHPKLYDYINQTYKDFLAVGGEFPTCFQMCGPVTSGISIYAWSVLEDLYVSTEPPQWSAIRLFNTRKRRIRIAT